MRPLIGLTTYRETARWGVWHTSADLLPSTYARSIEAVEGAPVLLPPQSDPGAARAVVARIQGLVVSGGADLDPRRYDEEPGPRTKGWREDRDAWEIPEGGNWDDTECICGATYKVTSTELVRYYTVDPVRPAPSDRKEK